MHRLFSGLLSPGTVRRERGSTSELTPYWGYGASLDESDVLTDSGRVKAQAEGQRSGFNVPKSSDQPVWLVVPESQMLTSSSSAWFPSFPP